MSLKTGLNVEKQACIYLEAQGLKLLDSNYRTKMGEIDLIMRDNDFIAFIEVRYRKSIAFGGALESVTKSKQRKIIKTAEMYLVHKKLWEKYPIRFDIVTVEGNPAKTEWIKSAFAENY